LTSTTCGGGEHLTQWIGTGEVGIEKEECLYEELGEGTVELTRTVKNAIAPMGLRIPEKYALIALSLYRDSDVPWCSFILSLTRRGERSEGIRRGR
jgi:hypothetical protein